MAKDFVHCHVHSEFSLLDGASRVPDLIKQAKAFNMPAVALTDHGSMYGTVDFYQKAYGENIKPIIGCELYVAPKSRTERKGKMGHSTARHIVLLAKNEKGYKNLIKLCSIGYLEGFYYKPRVDHEILEKHSEGLIAMTACMGGEIPMLLREDKDEDAKKLAKWYKERFDFYLELQDHGLDEQKKVNRKLIELSQQLQIPLVATNDSHYTFRSDAKAQDILLCIQTNKLVTDESRMKFPGGPEYYFKSSEEMYEIFKETPEALKNTMEIAEKCNLTIKMNVHLLPSFPVPPNKTAEGYVSELTLQGFKQRFKNSTETLQKRLDYELKIIEEMGFAAYFLIVWDYIDYAKRHGIITGPGRGSAAGSLVAYCLGITDINPLEYNLLFERFLNPERISMPDIDIDFCVERRDEVIKYVTEKYSQERVSQIITLGTMGAKMAIRDVGRALGFAVSEADRLAKMIPAGPHVTLTDVLQEGMDLYKQYNADPRVKELIDIARALEGVARHASVHAAGVVISKEPVANVVPLQKMNDGQIVTQFQMGDLEKIGLLKMDFLGLRNLTMIAKSLKIIKQTQNIDLEMSAISYDDKPTYDLFCSGETIGVFQLESAGMRQLVRNLAPNKFEEIIALIALYRPGPLEVGMVDSYVECKHGRKAIKYPHQNLEPILKDTYGVYVYQEQIMQTAQVIAGYSLGQADILRKAMGKKNPEAMAKQRSTFIEGAAKNGISKILAENLFNDMEKFAGYGFNKSHSAAYAVITYRTAYLKANYPVEYMAALLSSVIGTQDKVPLYINECRRMGIEVLPPDINTSESDFCVQGNKIRFGLSAIKNVGVGAVENIIDARKKNGEFISLYDFCTRVDLHTVNKRALESLVLAGAFDSLNKGHRKQLKESVIDFIPCATKEQENKNTGQTSLFECLAPEENIAIQEPALKECKPYTSEEMLGFEKDVIGVYVSGHPLLKWQEYLDILTSHTVSDVAEEKEGKEIVIGGLVADFKKTMTKKNEAMGILKIEDLTGMIEVVVYPEAFDKYKDVIVKDYKVLVYGKIGIGGREEETRIILTSARPLEAMKMFYINLPDDIEPQKLVTLRCILDKYSGDIPVILNFNSHSDEVIALPNDLWIKEDEKLFSQLTSLLGDKSFYFK